MQSLDGSCSHTHMWLDLAQADLAVLRGCFTKLAAHDAQCPCVAPTASSIVLEEMTYRAVLLLLQLFLLATTSSPQVR